MGKLCPLCCDVLADDVIAKVAAFCSDGPVFAWPLSLVVCRGCTILLEDCGLRDVNVGYEVLPGEHESITATSVTNIVADAAAAAVLPQCVLKDAVGVRRMTRDDMKYVALC